jgi:3-hydroxyacyl-CoA dehydrogenase
MKACFLGVHFFNPPRYLRLLELIPIQETAPEVLQQMQDLGENILGKGTVICKDTPNFIANRIGMYSIMNTLQVMEEGKYSIQEVDTFTGTLIGHAGSATFRTADLVGLDTLVHVANNLYNSCTEDEERDVFKIPVFLEQLVKQGALGAKSGKGFFIKDKDRNILHLDYLNIEEEKEPQYLSKEKIKLESIGKAKKIEDLSERLEYLLWSSNPKDKVGDFLWNNFSALFLYSIRRMGEIADSLVDIDNGMKWGFGWQFGPFEKWDAIGVRRSVQRMEEEGTHIPQTLKVFLDQGHETFYKVEEGTDYFYDFATESYKEIIRDSKVVLLHHLKRGNNIILQNDGASLIDLGNGVACFEFHTKMNAVGQEIISMSQKVMEEVEQNWKGLVIANQGPHFCAGANLMMILMAILDGEWENLERIVKDFQDMNMRFRYSDVPVVAAPFGMTLGGGCEVCLHADQTLAHGETYMGLVEAGVGLLPAGGGTKEMLLRSMSKAPSGSLELPFLKEVFESIAMAKVSTSAGEARQLGFLTSSDSVVINRDHQIHYAKSAVLGMAEAGYRRPHVRNDIKVAGRSGMATVKLLLGGMLEGGYISEHDYKVSLKVGQVLTGGNLTGSQLVTEQYLLDLEREHFLSLCGTLKTQERIQHMLTKGKPLRN